MISRRPPSFFKMLLDPSAHHLPMPPDFVCMHLKNKIPKGPIVLHCANGCHVWRLKIEKIGENYCFTHGWNNVVQDKHLGFGDFLVIWLVNRSTFKMLVYSPNGCEKIVPPKEHGAPPKEHVVPPKEHVEHVIVVDDDDDDDSGGNGGGGDDGDGDGDYVGDGDDDPSFVSIMSKTHESRLRLPGHFTGLPGIHIDGTVTIKDLKGKEWHMGVRLDKSYKSERYLLTHGWPKFYRYNKLSEGDKCAFKFIRSEGKMLLAKVTKKKWSTRQSWISSDEGGTQTTNRHDADVATEDDYLDVVKKPRLMPHQNPNFVYF